ncbi:MAG: hypothetical protein JST58_02055 [Bacteroidetes bacterium]|jgi:hypothetical protein|nr:hypothetical protein [Bacteroidota bacterium]
MKLFIVFVLLEYLVGCTFAVSPIYLITSIYDDLFYSIIFSFIVGSISMVLGICLVGYFYLRIKNLLQKFGSSIFHSFLGVILFLLVDFLVNIFLPSKLSGILFLLLLTGAIAGFNFESFKKSKKINLNKTYTQLALPIS